MFRVDTMKNYRVYEVAKRLDIDTTDLFKRLESVGIDIKSPVATIGEEDIKKVLEAMQIDTAKMAELFDDKDPETADTKDSKVKDPIVSSEDQKKKKSKRSAQALDNLEKPRVPYTVILGIFVLILIFTFILFGINENTKAIKDIVAKTDQNKPLGSDIYETIEKNNKDIERLDDIVTKINKDILKYRLDEEASTMLKLSTTLEDEKMRTKVEIFSESLKDLSDKI